MRARKVGHMEENTQKFEEKLKELVTWGKKKKSILELQEINDFFQDMELDAEQMETVYERLEANNIDVLRISDDSDDVNDDDIILNEEDEVDMEKIDLSVPDGISIEDPVRMYLKEIGKRREWKTETRKRRRSWQRPTYDWLSASQNVMWDAECCSLI